MKNKLLNIYKLNKLFKKGLTPLLSALTVFNFCVGSASAATYTAFIRYLEPTIPDIGGYVVFYNERNWYDSEGNLLYFAFYPYENNFNFNGDAQYVNYVEFIRPQVYVTDTGITFRLSAVNNFDFAMTGYVVIYRVYRDGEVRIVANEYVSLLDNPYSYTFNELGSILSVNIVGNFASISNTLSVYNDLQVVWGDDLALYNLVDSVNSLLTTVNGSINSQGALINDKLTSIINALTQGDNNGAISDVSSSGISSVENKENALVGSSPSTSDLNVSINPNAASVVWTLIDDLVTSNAKVFAMFISILTIGVIGLILNR